MPSATDFLYPKEPQKRRQGLRVCGKSRAVCSNGPANTERFPLVVGKQKTNAERSPLVVGKQKTITESSPTIESRPSAFAETLPTMVAEVLTGAEGSPTKKHVLHIGFII